MVAAQVLKHLETRLGSLIDKFDLLAGTSTGAILTAGLSVGYTPTSLQDLYFEDLPKIFRNPRSKFLGLIRRKPKYRGKDLSVVLMDRLGKDRPMSNTPKHLMISAYNTTQNKSHYFKSWDPVSSSLPIWRCVQASASAPTYHPMHEIDGQCYTDGGVFANSPVIGALNESITLDGPGSSGSVNIVSVGTGYKEISRECNDDARNAGELWWAGELPGIFLDGFDESSHSLMKRLTNSGVINYWRLNVPVVSKSSDELDFNKLEDAINRMERYLTEGKGLEKLNQIENTL